MNSIPSCVTVSLFTRQSLASRSLVSTQSWRKTDFPLKVWNLFSTKNTEEVTIAPNAQREGIIDCGVACHKNPDCGGILYEKSSGSCAMKSVNNHYLCNLSLMKYWLVFVFTKPAQCLRSRGFFGNICQNWEILSMPRIW